MTLSNTFTVSLAQSEADLAAAQRLRYEVFVAEMGAGGSQVDHAARRERDAFDAFADHLLVREDTSEEVVGVYRLLRGDQATRAGAFYSESEFDITPLKKSGRRLLELGRSCLHRDYRGGSAMFYLWNGLADYVARYDIDVLFGVASFPGTDVNSLAEPLALLHHNYSAHNALRARALPDVYQSMNLLPEDEIERRRATLAVPALIKAYLRLGGVVGDGAFVDHEFNTTDVFMILDTAKMNARQRKLYAREK